MPPKPIRLALGYDSYTVEGDTAKSLVFAFESPPLARLAFAQHLAKAKRQKRLAASDATRTVTGLDPERVQLAWDGDHVIRAWFTAREDHDAATPLRLASELLASALALPAFARVHEVGIGLQQWHDSHRASFDPVLDVLAAARPALTALALGDYDNTRGHVLRLAEPSRIAALYPQLAELRITTTQLASLAGAELPALRSLSLRATTYDAGAFVALDRAWPALASLAVGWRRAEGERAAAWEWLVAGERTPALRHLALLGSSVTGKLLDALAASPLLPRLASLELRGDGDVDGAAQSLRRQLAAFAHVEVRLPEDVRIGGLEQLRVVRVPSPEQYRASRG